MPSVSEDKLSSWTRPAFDNEDARREYTEKLIREAIKADSFLSTISSDISVYAKGSYANSTNVRRDSDVDIAVEYTGAIHNDYGDVSRDEVWKARGLTAYRGALKAAGGNYLDVPRFKAAIEDAMKQAFGASAVTRGNKVITVRESERSLAADVVPSQTFRKYLSVQTYRQGIRLLPDKYPGYEIRNYPAQHYAEGVDKNGSVRTRQRYKSCVRILKNLENQMVVDGAHPEVPSFLVESLVWNCPDEVFLRGSWADRLRGILFHIWDELNGDQPNTDDWLEANGIKYLFYEHQKWGVADARDFAHAAWQYVKGA